MKQSLLAAAFVAATVSSPSAQPDQGVAGSVKPDLTSPVVKSRMAKKDKKLPPKVQAPPPPKEEYIKFEKREPSPEDLRMALEAAARNGVRPGAMLVLIDHESAQTWHPHVRPQKPKGKPLRITTTGKIEGDAGGTAVGIGQYTEPTWLHNIYRHGPDVIKDISLPPDKVEVISKAHDSITRELSRTGKKPGWDAFVQMVNGDFSKKPEIQDVLKLRSDAPFASSQSGPVPFEVLAKNLKDHQKALKDAGLPGDSTFLYILHHYSLGLAKEVLRNPTGIPAASAEAVSNNGKILKTTDRETGEEVRKTGAETLAVYREIMNDDRVAALEKKYYGRVFEDRPSASSPRTFKTTGGQEVKVRPALVLQPLSAKEFVEAFKIQSPPVTDEAQVPGVVSKLGRLGYVVKPTYAGRNRDRVEHVPRSLDDRELRKLVETFKTDVGLPFPARGLDQATLTALDRAVGRIDNFGELQAKQQAALEGKFLAPNGAKPPPYTLRAGAKPASDVEAQYVRSLKQDLITLGLLAEPSRKNPLNDSVDNALLGQISEFQSRQGLTSTLRAEGRGKKGTKILELDFFTRQTLREMAEAQQRLMSVPGPQSSLGRPAPDFNFASTPPFGGSFVPRIDTGLLNQRLASFADPAPSFSDVPASAPQGRSPPFRPA